MNITPEQWTRIVEALGGVLVLVIGALASAIALIIKQRFDNQRELLTIRTHVKQAASDMAAVRAETSHNHGSSMKDKVDKIDDLVTIVERLDETIQRLDQHLFDAAKDMRGMRKDIGRLADTDLEDRRRSDQTHTQIFAELAELRRQHKGEDS